MWTKEDQEAMQKFGKILGDATFKVSGSDVMWLYRAFTVLSKVGKVIDDSLNPIEPKEITPIKEEAKEDVPTNRISRKSGRR